MEQSLDENTQVGVSTKDGLEAFFRQYLTFLTLCWQAYVGEHSQLTLPFIAVAFYDPISSKV